MLKLRVKVMVAATAPLTSARERPSLRGLLHHLSVCDGGRGLLPGFTESGGELKGEDMPALLVRAS